MMKFPKFSVIVLLLIMMGSRHSFGFTDPLDSAAVASPLAEMSLLNGISTAGDRIVAVGQRGHVLYSDDNGVSWKQAEVPVSTDLTDVHFATAEHGWAVGHQGVVLKTTDGGERWVKQLDGLSFEDIFENFEVPEDMDDFRSESLQLAAERFALQGIENSLLSVWFENKRDGFAVGVFNLILRTSDGGDTWSPWIAHTENPEELHFYSAKRVNNDLYLTGERGIVLRLDPHKGRFVDVSVDYPGTLFGLTGHDDVLFVFGLRGHLFRSIDKGVTWNEIETGLNSSITGGTIMPDSSVVLVSQNGKVLRSDDDGKTFVIAWDGGMQSATDVIAVDQDKLVTVGVRGLTNLSLSGSDKTDNRK